MKRYHMHKYNLMVEHTDRHELERIRKQYDAFRGARIIEVLQLLPSEVPIGKIIFRAGYEQRAGYEKEG